MQTGISLIPACSSTSSCTFALCGSLFLRVCGDTSARVTLSDCRLLDVNPEGSVPVVKDRETGEWFVDSAKFVDYLEDKHPLPALGKSTDAPDA